MMKQSRQKKIAPRRKYVLVGVTKYRDRLFRYSDIPEPDRPNGWIDPKKFRPHPFDLVLLRLEGHIKTQPGWFTGTIWDGLRINPDHKIMAWLRERDTYE
jgi:hypothetical protein